MDFAASLSRYLADMVDRAATPVGEVVPLGAGVGMPFATTLLSSIVTPASSRKDRQMVRRFATSRSG